MTRSDGVDGPAAILDAWESQLHIAAMGVHALRRHYPDAVAESLGGFLTEADLAKFTGFLRGADPATREQALRGLSGRPTLPTPVVAEVARAELGLLGENSEALGGLGPRSCASPLLRPDSDTNLTVLGVSELKRSGPRSVNDPSAVSLTLGTASVINNPARLHVHCAAGMEPFQVAAMANRAALADSPTIVTTTPSVDPGSQYGRADLREDVLRGLVAVYLRHGQYLESPLAVSADEHATMVLEELVPTLNDFVESRGCIGVELVPIPDELRPPRPSAPPRIRSALPPRSQLRGKGGPGPTVGGGPTPT